MKQVPFEISILLFLLLIVLLFFNGLTIKMFKHANFFPYYYNYFKYGKFLMLIIDFQEDKVTVVIILNMVFELLSCCFGYRKVDGSKNFRCYCLTSQI